MDDDDDVAVAEICTSIVRCILASVVKFSGMCPVSFGDEASVREANCMLHIIHTPVWVFAYYL